MGRFDDERRDMIAVLRDRLITDEKILRAMTTVERHLFVPEPFTNRSYEDSALPIGKGQTISQPYTVAFMTQALGVRTGDRILEIGTGSGYQASVLAVLGAHVFSIERDLDLLASARKMFDRLGYRIATKGGDGRMERIRPFQRHHRDRRGAGRTPPPDEAARRRGEARDPRRDPAGAGSDRHHPLGTGIHQAGD